MGHGVEARVPFLDLSVVELAMRLPLDLKMRDGQEKWIVRRAFADVLPEYVRRRPKNPMSYSSGLHERARLYKPFFARLHRSFGYDLLEPGPAGLRQRAHPLRQRPGPGDRRRAGPTTTTPCWNTPATWSARRGGTPRRWSDGWSARVGPGIGPLRPELSGPWSSRLDSETVSGSNV